MGVRGFVSESATPMANGRHKRETRTARLIHERLLRRFGGRFFSRGFVIRRLLGVSLGVRLGFV